MFRISRWSMAMLMIFAATMSMVAQTSKGVTAGTVSDPNGAVIQNAIISAKSVETGEARQVTTGPTGAYRIEAVNPGQYDITVRADNFQATTRLEAKFTF